MLVRRTSSSSSSLLLLLRARRSLSSSSSSSSSLSFLSPFQQQQRRAYSGPSLLSDLAVHSTQLGGCLQLPVLLSSPLGTAMWLLLAYNVVVVGTKHVNYAMEITAKDYVQDQQLYVIMRYGILSCILLGMEVMFVEV